MNDALAAARDYIERGWAPIPVPFRTKGPLLDEWQTLRINAETARCADREARRARAAQLMGPLVVRLEGGRLMSFTDFAAYIGLLTGIFTFWDRYAKGHSAFDFR